MTMILSVVAVAALGLALGWLLGLASQWLGRDHRPGGGAHRRGPPRLAVRPVQLRRLRPGGDRAVRGRGAGHPGRAMRSPKLAEILGTTFARATCPTAARCWPACAPTPASAARAASSPARPTPSWGRQKQLHVVPRGGLHRLRRLRRGLPTGGIDLEGIPVTLRNWRWHKPGVGHA